MHYSSELKSQDFVHIVKNACNTGAATKTSDLFSFPNNNGFGFGGRPDVGPPLEPLDRVHNFRHRSTPTMMLLLLVEWGRDKLLVNHRVRLVKQALRSLSVRLRWRKWLHRGFFYSNVDGIILKTYFDHGCPGPSLNLVFDGLQVEAVISWGMEHVDGVDGCLTCVQTLLDAMGRK